MERVVSHIWQSGPSGARGSQNQGYSIMLIFWISGDPKKIYPAQVAG